MFGLIIITIFILVLIFSADIAKYLVWGKFINKPHAQILWSIDMKNLRRNIYNEDLSFGNSECFITIFRSVLGCYVIQGMGVVPFWSPVHKKIKSYYKLTEWQVHAN